MSKTQAMAINQTQVTKIAFGRIEKLFFHVWNALDWSILIRIEISKFQHVADHLLYQCSQMGFGISKVWNLQSFQSKSLPLTFSEFLFTVFEIYWFLGMIFHKGLPNWKLVDLGYFWSGHFMGWNFQHPFDYKFFWDDRLYADNQYFFSSTNIKGVTAIERHVRIIYSPTLLYL